MKTPAELKEISSEVRLQKQRESRTLAEKTALSMVSALSESSVKAALAGMNATTEVFVCASSACITSDQLESALTKQLPPGLKVNVCVRDGSYRVDLGWE